MTHYLVATDSVHTTAAAADYLGDRLGPGDRVTVLAVVEAGDARDAGDAVNVASVRLGTHADLETITREGPAAPAILTTATELAVDELLLGARAGTPASGTELGTTARAVLVDATVPVVVLPLGATGPME